MLHKTPPFRGLNVRIPIKGRGFVNHLKDVVDRFDIKGCSEVHGIKQLLVTGDLTLQKKGLRVQVPNNHILA